MAVASCSSATVIPALSAYRRYHTRSGSGVATRALMSSSAGSAGVPHRSLPSQPKPKEPTSSPRSAFWKASLKVRPMAIVSPTLFICVVRRLSASGNFSNANRGTLTTT
jgi:hypothetical protein